jgi:hypothetical protein
MILNLGDKSLIQPETITLLNQMHVTVLAQASLAKDPLTMAEKWKSNNDLGLTGLHSDEWERYTSDLNRAGVTLNPSSEDGLLWTGGDQLAS